MLDEKTFRVTVIEMRCVVVDVKAKNLKEATDNYKSGTPVKSYVVETQFLDSQVLP